MTQERRAPSKPFTLVKVDVSKETIAALEYLLQEARKGNLVGLVYGAAMRGNDYFVDTAGEAHRNPMFGLSMASVLWRRLSDMEADKLEA